MIVYDTKVFRTESWKSSLHGTLVLLREIINGAHLQSVP
jgi:hypothetical protein